MLSDRSAGVMFLFVIILSMDEGWRQTDALIALSYGNNLTNYKPGISPTNKEVRQRHRCTFILGFILFVSF